MAALYGCSKDDVNSNVDREIGVSRLGIASLLIGIARRCGYNTLGIPSSKRAVVEDQARSHHPRRSTLKATLIAWINTLFAQLQQEPIDGVQQSYEQGLLYAKIAFLVVAAIFVYIACKTLISGFKISEKKIIEGKPAKIIAPALIALAVGVAVFVLFFFPELSSSVPPLPPAP